MLVRSLSTNVLFHTATTCAVRVASIQDVKDNITGVDDLVELVPNALGGTLHEDELSCGGEVAVLVLLVRLTRRSRQEFCLLETLGVVLMHGVCTGGKVFDGAKVQLGLLALSLSAESLCEGLRGDGNLGGVLLQAVDVALLLDQAHGQLVALHEEGGRVGGLRLHGRAEGVESILRDDAGVVEPLPVGLDAGDRRLARLVRGGLGDVSGSVPLGLAVCETLEDLDLLCRAGVVLAAWLQILIVQCSGRIPVEVLALDLDVAHAIAGFTLALLAGSLFFAGTHGCCVRVSRGGEDCGWRTSDKKVGENRFADSHPA